MRLSWRLAVWLLTALVGLGLVLAVGYGVVELVFEVLPNEYAGNGQSRSGVSTLAVQLLGGLLLVVGGYFTARTFWLNRGGQIAERYARAIGQLGNGERAVRLGGIYALERIARDSSYDHVRVTEVLTAYLRDRAEWRGESAAPAPETGASPEAAAARRTEGNEWRPGRPPLPVQAVIAVLGRRNARQDRYKLDLHGTDLRDVKFGRGNFKGAILEGANLEGAHLAGAKLDCAELDRAILRKADVKGSRLRKATLKGADLEGACLAGAKLNRAELDRAILRKTNLEGSNLRKATLNGADLEAAVYDRDTDLKGATYDQSTKWPGFDFLAAGAVKHKD